MKVEIIVRFIEAAGLLLISQGVWAQTAARASRDIQVKSEEVWSATDLELKPGERVVFSAGGTARCPGEDSPFGPEGIPRGFKDLLRVMPVAQAGRGALIGRIGDAEVAQPFVIGPSAEAVTPVGGKLALGINRSESDACTAGFSVHIEVFPPSDGARAAVAKRVDSLDGANAALFAKLPRRVSDKQGNLGDVVNFLVLGSAETMQRVFEAAGWVTVDRDIRTALVTGLIDSLSKEAYLTLPMSQLYLFDRPQDYGWAHAEPIKVVASRHHLRLWRAPYQAAGSTLWVGAATHDIGFDRDRRNNGITHKIDSDVDQERAFVEKTLTSTGLVSEFTYVMPDNAVREANTATGGRFQSDGQVLVLKLAESAGSGGK
jgi:hypothetical protein